jgi:hypothetical protein
MAQRPTASPHQLRQRQSPPSNNAGTVIPEVSPLDAYKHTLIGYTERRRRMQSSPSNNAGTVIPEVSPHDPPLDAHKTYTLIGYTERRRQMQSPPSNDAGTVILEVSPYDEKKANGYINERNHKLGRLESGARLNAMRVDYESREWDVEAGQTRGVVASNKKEAVEDNRRLRVAESEH